jgi:hypothetical protein
MASQTPLVLEAIPEWTHKARKGCQYNAEERAVLSKYKEAYKKQTTHVDRENLLRGKILVDIFNYWFTKEGVMPSADEATRRIEVFS